MSKSSMPVLIAKSSSRCNSGCSCAGIELELEPYSNKRSLQPRTFIHRTKSATFVPSLLPTAPRSKYGPNVRLRHKNCSLRTALNRNTFRIFAATRYWRTNGRRLTGGRCRRSRLSSLQTRKLLETLHLSLLDCCNFVRKASRSGAG